MNLTKAVLAKLETVAGETLASMAQDTMNAATGYAKATAVMVESRTNWSTHMLAVCQSGATGLEVHSYLMFLRSKCASDSGEYRNLNNGLKDFRKGAAAATGRSTDKMFTREWDAEEKVFVYTVNETEAQRKKWQKLAADATVFRSTSDKSTGFVPKAKKANKQAPVSDAVALEDMTLSDDAESDWSAILATVENAVANERIPQVDATEALDGIRQYFIRSHKATL